MRENVEVTAPDEIKMVTATCVVIEGYGEDGKKRIATAFYDADGDLLDPVVALGLIEYGKLRYMQRYEESKESES
jgi:hypothetical protein